MIRAPLTILIPAAGASSRMRGADKLLEPVGLQPMLRHQVVLARAVCSTVYVTLRPEDAARRAVVADLDVTILAILDAATGMAASIRAGAAAAKSGGLMILPADMPDLTSADLQVLIDIFDQLPTRIIRATAHDDTPGHPVIFPADCLTDLSMITGDVGARAVLQAHQARITLIALPDQHATTDLDSPEDWAAWRAIRAVQVLRQATESKNAFE